MTQPLKLRDYLAGQALIGLLAQNAHPAAPGVSRADYAQLACDAYLLADTMLEARVAGEESA